MRFHEFFLLCFLLMIPGPGAGQGLTPEQVLGCYDIQLGPWDQPDSLTFDSLRYQPPPRVEFDTVAFDPRSADTGPFLVRPAPGSRASRHRFTLWGIEGDSIRASWTTGFVGLSVTMVPEDGVLRGYALTVTDVEGSRRYRAEVVASPVSCSAPPEFPASESQWVVRKVDLGTGASVVLGEPLPEERHVSGKSSEFGYVFHGPAQGLFEGAILVKARVPGHEVVTQIRMEFPATMTLETLVERLEAEMGHAGIRHDVGGMVLVSWEDVTATLSVASSGDQLTVNLWDPRLR